MAHFLGQTRHFGNATGIVGDGAEGVECHDHASERQHGCHGHSRAEQATQNIGDDDARHDDEGGKCSGFHRNRKTLDHVGAVTGDRSFSDGVDRALARGRVVFGDVDDRRGDHEANHAAPEQIHGREATEIDGHAAEDIGDHGVECGERKHAGCDDTLVERAHDVVAGAQLHEVGADDGGNDASAANGQRQHHAGQLELGGKCDGCENHGGNSGHHIGFEQVSRHAGAIAHVVANVVGDGGGVAGIIFGNACFNLAHHVAAHVSTLGEDAAAETREDGDEGGTEGQSHQRVDNRAACRVKAHGAREEAEIEGYAQKAQTRHQKTRHRARLEGQVEATGQRLGGGLRHAHIGAHRDVHADEAGSAGENGTDGKADR